MRPTNDQNHSYGECLRLDRLIFDERGRGRSGLPSPELSTVHANHYQVVADALASGVTFDRAAFPA